VKPKAVKKEIKPAPKPKIVEKPKAAKAGLHKTKVVEKQAHLPVKEEVRPKVEAKLKVEAHKPVVAEPAKHAPTVAQPPKPTAVEAPKPVIEPPKPILVPPPVTLTKELELELPITVKDLAIRLVDKSSNLIKTLMGMGVMAGLNNFLKEEIVAKVCEKYGFAVKKALAKEEIALELHTDADSQEQLKPRSPIVTLMGHVDHGKTSLLDAIRKSKVAESEHGGITQHIGAYRVVLPHGEITFLDTPGHEAFTAMRARGAKVTDMVILVVAADDGIMPQTKEAIDHARAAGVSIIVAVNKIDKSGADLDRVKKQLSALDLTAEDWGGKTITVAVSAKTGEGIDTLLEMVLLEAQMMELRANPDRLAKGIVLEAKLIKSKGPIATLLVQNGTLHLNDNIIVGKFYGKIRAMYDARGHSVTKAMPSFPVEVLGISGVPEAGEQFYVIEDEKTAKNLSLQRQEQERDQQIISIKRMGLEDLYSQIQQGKLKELNLVIKADAQGSLEAIKDTLGRINTEEIKMSIIHDGIGNINTSDVILAIASNALILGFNIVVDEQAKELISKEGQDVRIYNIIYELANDIRAALTGMLAPKLKKVFLGRVEIKKVFRLSSHGVIAGCIVSKGKVIRSAEAELVRNGTVIYTGKISSLKRFKDDVKEVEEGFECGVALANFDAILEGDVIEAFQVQKIARVLEE
ncbi:MAG: translation initiation factor IF-2, partial [Candidatus Omnitrophica bacterium]|nr:translation initiation factor IF-2 [Candidatus Omnitrophota bacterium]